MLGLVALPHRHPGTISGGVHYIEDLQFKNAVVSGPSNADSGQARAWGELSCHMVEARWQQSPLLLSVDSMSVSVFLTPNGRTLNACKLGPVQGFEAVIISPPMPLLRFSVLYLHGWYSYHTTVGRLVVLYCRMP